MASKIVITKAGRNALFNAERTGTGPVTLAYVGYGTGKYTATESMNALAAEFKRLDTIAGVITDDSVISLRVIDRSSDVYTVNEFGIYTDGGVLFAIYSQTDAILQKAADSVSHLAIDIKVEDINVQSIAFGDTNFEVPQATTETKGVVELATIDESLAGDDAYRAITPQGLDARVGVTESFIQTDVMTSINDLNARVTNNTLTPFCVNQGPLSASGVPNILGFVNDVSRTVDVAFVQPELTANGTLGGDAFAVFASQNNNYAYDAFNSGTSSWGGSTVPSPSNPTELTIYNPVALKLASITFTNPATSSNVWSTMNVQGSDDNATWVDLGTFTNSIRTAGGLATASVNATTAYKYFKLSFTVNSANAAIAIAHVQLNATMNVTHTGGRVTFKGPLVATTAQGEKFTADAVANLDLSTVTANVAYIYLDRSGAPMFAVGEFHASDTTPSSFVAGDVWFKTLEPLASFHYWGGEWHEINVAPIGEVYLDGAGKITSVSTYPYNQNGYTVNSGTVATATTFGLVRTASEEDTLNCECNEASVTPATLYKMANFRTVSTAYAVGDTVGCPFYQDLFLRCTTAGTTSADPLDTREVEAGATLTDGSVTWLVCKKPTTVELLNDVTGSATFNSNGKAAITATLKNSGATAGSYGPSANATPSFGSTFNVPYVTVDAKGRVTAISTKTVKIPATPSRTRICPLDTNVSFSTGGSRLTAIVHIKGYMELNQTNTFTDTYAIQVNGTTVGTTNIVFQVLKSGGAGFGRILEIDLTGYIDVSTAVSAGGTVKLVRTAANIPFTTIRNMYAHVTVGS